MFVLHDSVVSEEKMYGWSDINGGVPLY